MPDSKNIIHVLKCQKRSPQTATGYPQTFATLQFYFCIRGKANVLFPSLYGSRLTLQGMPDLQAFALLTVHSFSFRGESQRCICFVLKEKQTFGNLHHTAAGSGFHKPPSKDTLTVQTMSTPLSLMPADNVHTPVHITVSSLSTSATSIIPSFTTDFSRNTAHKGAPSSYFQGTSSS